MSSQSIRPAARTADIRYAIRDIVLVANEVAKTGKKMLYLNVGDPNVYDFCTPSHIVDRVVEAMRKNLNGYASSTGIPEAIKAIEGEAHRKGINNVLDAFVTTGASEAIDLALTALADAGENVLTPTPGYPLYTAIQSKLGLAHNPYYLDEKNNWEPDIEDIKSKINSKTRGIVIINPNNPTGTVYSKETLTKLVNLAMEHNLLIFADEIYDKLLLDCVKHTSIASINPDASVLTFSGLSKNFLAPGFRIGWGVASGRKELMTDYLEAINKLLRSRVSSNHPEQYCIKDALEGDQSHIADVNRKLTSRRDITMKMLNSIPGISLVKPQGAFYAFASVDVVDDSRFCTELLKATGVVLVPGSGFGEVPGTSHFRVVILPQEPILEEAYNKIGDFKASYKD